VRTQKDIGDFEMKNEVCKACNGLGCPECPKEGNPYKDEDGKMGEL